MRRRVHCATALAFGLLVSGCQTLGDVPVGVCGNQIVDPNEDCDGTIAATHDAALACGLPGTARACRFDCSQKAQACPADYVCGADGICRQPSGQFAVLDTLPASTSYVSMADFDGDGRADLVSLDYDSGTIEVRFFDGDGIVTRSFSTSSDGVLPVVGRLDTTRPGPGTDLVYGFASGLGVLRGQSDRSFATTGYPVFRSDKLGTAAVTALDVIPPKPIDPTMTPLDTSSWQWIGDEILILPDALDKVYCPEAGNAFKTAAVLELPMTGPWPRPLPVGNVDEEPTNSPCSELILPDANKQVVHVFTPCWRPGPGQDLTWNADMAGKPVTTYPDVKMPMGAIPLRVMVAHMNPLEPGVPSAGRDRHLDLVIEAKVGPATEVYVAYGMGNGTFRSAPPLLPTDTADNMAASYPGLTALPLAVADFNQDGMPDFATAAGLLVSVPYANPAKWTLDALPIAGGMGWGEAMAVDYNGDGRVDLVAAAADGMGVQLYTRTAKGEFNPELVATEGRAGDFALGDFDGDLNVDIAFRESLPNGSAALRVMFGRSGELPVAPALIGQLDGIDQVIAGNNVSKRIPQNGMDDLLVMSSLDEGGMKTEERAAVFLGEPNRDMQAPYFFLPETGSVTDFPAFVGAATGTFHKAAAGMNGMAGMDHADVAAIAVTGPLDARTAKLWLLPPTGAARFPLVTEILPAPMDITKPMVGKIEPWDRALVGAVDIDGKDKVDEAIILLPEPGDAKDMKPSAKSRLFVASVDAAGTGFDVAEVMGGLALSLWNRTGGQRNAPLCLARIDDDDHVDLVALDAAGAGHGSRPVIFWGTGDKGHPFEDAPTLLTLPDEGKSGKTEDVHGFTCIDLDADGYADIVAVTTDVAYSTAQVDAATGKHVGGKRTVALKPLVDPRDPQGQRALPGGVSVATGDIDDDKVPDLVISNPTSISLYLGKAVIP